MSVEARDWALHRAPHIGTDGKHIGHAAARVLYVLADRADRNGRNAWPSRKSIGETLDMASENVRLRLKELLDGGWIERAGISPHKTNRFTLRLDRVRPTETDLEGIETIPDRENPGIEKTGEGIETIPRGDREDPGEGIETIPKPSLTIHNRPEPARPGGDHRRQGGSRKLTARERLARTRAAMDAEHAPSPSVVGRDRSRADARGMDGSEGTGAGDAPTSPQDFVDVPLPYDDDTAGPVELNTAEPVDGDQEPDQTTEHDGGPVAPGDADAKGVQKPDTPEPEGAVRPSEPSNAPDPTGTRWTGKRLTGAARAERDQVLAAAHAAGESMRAVAARYGVSFGTVQGAVRRTATDQTTPENAA